ncbi:MAG: hypothetical protein LBD09_00765, partial [Treponema sp.]|nr:hypothetical protein [Treponema sp.]
MAGKIGWLAAALLLCAGRGFGGESTSIQEVSYRIAFPDSMFLNGVFGRHLPFRFVSPGIALDAGLGLDWLLLFSDDRKDADKPWPEAEKKEKETWQFGFNLGVRVYALVEIGIVDVNLFAGYSLILGHQDRSLPGVTHNPVIGASITIKW